MARALTINQDMVTLPNGLTYNDGDTAVITQAEFDRIPAGLFSGGSPILTDDGYSSEYVLESPDGTEYQIEVANGGALSTSEVS